MQSQVRVWSNYETQIATPQSALHPDPISGPVAASIPSVDGHLAQGGAESDRFGRTLGASPAMRRLYPFCRRLARSSVPLLIEGETGTGKEQLAESLHIEGPRCGGPFVVFDCTAVAPNLIESELFGHMRGAFTGATRTHQGVFERAHGGTLLIDEIGDLPLQQQARLLRAIDRLEVRRVGANQGIRVDVRLIAASRRNLRTQVRSGRFRDDLYHRLVVARVELPPLRARQGDIRLLATAFARALGGPHELREQLLQTWEGRGWPGNVRELRNAVIRDLTFGSCADVGAQEGAALANDASHHVANPGHDSIARVLELDVPLLEARQRILAEFERRYLERVMTSHGSVSHAATAAGIAPRHLRRLRAKHRI